MTREDRPSEPKAKALSLVIADVRDSGMTFADRYGRAKDRGGHRSVRCDDRRGSSMCSRGDIPAGHGGPCLCPARTMFDKPHRDDGDK